MRLDFASYSVEVSDESIAVFLDGRRYFVLSIQSALDVAGSPDTDAPLSAPEISRGSDGVSIAWRSRTDLWEEKVYEVRFEERLFRYRVKVRGAHKIGSLRYFSGRGGSFYDFSRFFTPECAFLDQRHYRSMQYGCIDATTGRMSDYPVDPYASMHWIFTPPPFCYSLGFSSGPWIAAGVAPGPGDYNFSRFEYVPGANDFCFRLTYDGMTETDGEWTSPEFLFIPAGDEYAALEVYCEQLRADRLVPQNRHPRADWWSRNIFCGWGEQNVQAMRRGLARRSGSNLATQEMYDTFLGIIDEKRLEVGTIVIDDKWQRDYGTNEVDTDKWPDMRGWIDARHAEGRKVLLWLGAWNPEGLGPEECITDSEGDAACVDPTSPAYQARIREMMHRLLSPDPGCCNADGIKFDWTNGLPLDGAWTRCGREWGIELLKLLTKQIYDASKAAKPDALFITHTANPYFAECTDMLRLNDIYRGCREIEQMMAHRAAIAHIACPHALIDCDNSSAPDHTEWLNYMKTQPQIGVPSLYFLTGVDGTLEDITDADWDVLAPIWRRRD